MWSGGAKVTTYDEANKAGEQILRLTEESNALGRKATEAKNAKDDQESVYGRAGRAKAKAEDESTTRTNEARGRDDAVTSARESRDQYRQQSEDALRSLEPEKTRLAGLWDMQRFFQQRYEIDFFGAYQKGCLELILENENWGRAALLAWHAACAKVAAAELGQRSQLNPVMEKPTYFRIPELPRNQAPDYAQQAMTTQNELAEKEKNIRSRLADPYYAQVLSEKMARADKVRAEASTAKSTFEAAEKAAESAKAVYEKRRSEMEDAYKAANDKGHEISLVKNEIEAFRNGKYAEADKQNARGRRRGA